PSVIADASSVAVYRPSGISPLNVAVAVWNVGSYVKLLGVTTACVAVSWITSDDAVTPVTSSLNVNVSVCGSRLSSNDPLTTLGGSAVALGTSNPSSPFGWSNVTHGNGAPTKLRFSSKLVEMKFTPKS